MPSSEDLSAVTGANETTATTTTVATPVVVNGPLGDSALAFSPQSFAFGTLVTNSGSATKSFVVTNTSTYTLVLGTITGVNTNFSLTANTCTNGFSMVSNATCAFTVRFAPAVSGNLSAAITIPYDVVSASNQFSSLLSVTGAGTTLTGFAGLDAINNQTPTTMQLNWTDVAGAATYQVYNTDSGTPALLASVISANLVSGIGCAAGSCSYTATGLLPSTSHAYRVLASDFLGVQSINTHDVTSQTTADFLDITGAASAIAGACTPLTVALTLADHVTPETVQANTSIAISGLGSGTIHSDNTCGTSIASPVVIASGTSSTTFYFKDNVAESLALSATRSQNSSTTKAFTVNPSPAVASVVYAAAPATAYTASSATPMTAFTVAIKDSFGNVVTTNDSATVTLSLATGSGTLVPLSGTLTKTVSHGVATFDGVTYTKAETITIKATENASGSQYNVTSSGIAVNPSSIASVVYAVAPAATQTASSTPMSTFTAELKDAFGNIITTDSSTTITVSRVAGSGALGGTVTKTVSSGVATFDGVTYTKAETITIKATENASGKNVTSGSITVNPAAFSLSQSQISSAASVNSGASMTVTLTAKDAFGNSNPSGIASVGFTSSLVGGTGTYGTVTDAGSGVYTAAFTGIAAGSVTLGATINAGVVTSTPSPATITVNPSPTIASVVYGVAPSTPYTASNSVAMATFTAAIVDANGNVITTNFTAHITVLGVGSTTLGGTLTKTVSGGVAAFDDITYTKAETIQIKATEDASGSNLNVTSGSVTVNPSPTVASLAWVVPPATAYTASNTTPMTTFTAAVKDSFGNIITTNSTSQLHLGLSLGSGSLSATVYVSVSNGIATFSDVTYTKPETVRLTVDLSPFSVTSSDITVTAHLAFTTQPSSSGDTDTALPQQPVVAVQDGAGATAGGATNSITLTAYSDGACTVPVASALAAVANPLSATSGVATFSGMKILKTNVVRIGASAAGITSACSSAMAIAAGAVNLVQSSVAWVPASLIANNSATSSITVTLKDANGNAIPGKTVTATSDRGADTLSGSGGSTNSSGVVNLTAKSSSAGSSNITVIGNGSTLSPTAKILFLSATPLTDYQSRLFDGANPGDNSSSLKSIWKDLARSATTYAGSLFNFLFDGTSGWSGTPPRTYSDEVLSDNPVGYWRLGETSGTTAYDISGNAFNGTYDSGSTLGVAGALTNDTDQAVTFNGTTGDVQIPDNATLRMAGGSVTLESWFKTSGTNAYSVIVGKRNSSPVRIMSIFVDGGQYYQTVLGAIVCSIYDGAGNSCHVATPYSMMDGVWHHTACTYSGSTLTLYSDGQYIASKTNCTPGIAAEDGPLTIGVDGYSSDRHFNGSIDEVAVYPTALSASRILAHYNTGVHPDHPLIFDGATSNSYVDFGTGVNNNANFSFETWIKPANAAATGKVILSNGTTTNWGASNETDTGLTIRQSGTYPGKLELYLGEKAEQSYSQAVLADNPVGYWRLNETSGTSASDSSGNAQTGTYTNSPTLGQTGAYSSVDSNVHSVLLNGSTQYVSVPNNPITQISGPFSVTAWINTSAASVSYGGYVFTSESSAGASGAHYPGIEFTAADNSGGPSGGGLRCRVTYDWTAVLGEAHSTSAVNDGQWHMVGCTYDGAMIRLYVDGMPNGSAAYAGGIQAFTTDPIFIGKYSNASSFFSGLVQDVALFNQKLSDSRILAHYNAALKKKTCTSTSTLADNVWHFISGVFDSTGPTLKLFVDGTQECSVTNAGAAYTGSTNPLRAGRDSGASNSWAGQMADLRTYGSALTNSNVKTNAVATWGRFPNFPRTDSALVLWLGADSGVTTDTTAGSTTVSSWQNQSGTGSNAVQSTKGNQPLYVENGLNGKPVLRFDGVDDAINSASAPGGTNRSIFVVSASRDVTSWGPVVLQSGNGGITYGWQANWQGMMFNQLYNVENNVAEGAASPQTFSNNQFALATGIWNSAANVNKIYINGVLKGSDTTVLNGASGTIYIGNRDGLSFGAVDIAEILIYNQALSDSDRQAVESYLNAKYGLY